MKTKMVINIETNNIAPIFDDGKIAEHIMKQLESEIHFAITSWIKENIEEQGILTTITENYYNLELLSGIEEIEDVIDLKITLNDDTIINITRFVPLEEQIEKSTTLIDLEDKVVVPPMEIDINDEEEIFEEETEDDNNKEEE